jgi:hypothetical protein
MTATEMCKAIYEAVPEYHPYVFSVKPTAAFGYEQSIYVTFARVRRPTDGGKVHEIDCLNAPVNFMIRLGAPEARGWAVSGDAPAKLRARQFRGRNVDFRGFTASPEKAVAKLVAWLKASKVSLLGEGAP